MFAGPIVQSGTVYVAGNNRRLSALDAKKGSVLWRFEAGGEISAEPVTVDGLVVVATKDGEVTALAAFDGKRRWQVKVGGSCGIAGRACWSGVFR